MGHLVEQRVNICKRTIHAFRAIFTLPLSRLIGRGVKLVCAQGNVLACTEIWLDGVLSWPTPTESR